MQTALPNCIGFPPSINEHSTYLILGSMPGVTSLAHQQYYAHPQNRFWPLMALLLTGEAKPPLHYDDRLALLLRHRIALWDSIDTCSRTGSLDTAIHNIEANDFNLLLASYPQIHTICFNGAKSFQIFKKYNVRLLERNDIKFYPLPSTSPANARWKLDMLFDAWQKAFL